MSDSNERNDVNIDNKTDEYADKATEGLNYAGYTFTDAQDKFHQTANRGRNIFNKVNNHNNKTANSKSEEKKRDTNSKPSSVAESSSPSNDSKTRQKGKHTNPDNKDNNRATKGSENDKLSRSSTKTDRKSVETPAQSIKPNAKTGLNPVKKGEQAGTKAVEAGTKTAQSGAKTIEAGGKTAATTAKAGVEAGTVATETAAVATASTAPIWAIVLAVIAGILIFAIVLQQIKIAFEYNALALLLTETEESYTDTELTSEAQRFEYLFKSFTESSNDKDRVKYKNIYNQIKENGYSTGLYAIYKELAYDCLYTNKSKAFEGQENVDMVYTNSRDKNYTIKAVSGNKSKKEKPIPCENVVDYTFDLYCGKYYLMYVEDIGYKQMQFSKKLYKSPNSYVIGRDDKKNKNITEYHYYYANNVIKMCLDAFVNPKTNKVYTSVSNYLPKYKEKHKNKIKGLSKDEIKLKCKEFQIKNAIKNLEGDGGPVEKCCVRAEKQENEKKIKRTYLNSWLYENDGYGNFYIYVTEKKNSKANKKHHFTKRAYSEILAYASSFESNGSADDICSLAKEQIGKKGSEFWTKTNYYKGGAADWCAIFCCWLMEQVGINPADVGWTASCSAWIANAKTKKLFHNKANYTPKAGDFIFYDNIPGDGKIASHVGFVAEVNGTQIHTVEGNATGQPFNVSKVADFDKNTDAGNIVGYITIEHLLSSSNSGKVSNVGSGAKSLKPVVVDPKYKGKTVSLTSSQRQKIESLVYHENGSNGYEGCLLLAQCIRDAIVSGNAKPETVKTDMGYDATNSGSGDANAKKAVSYIFDKGGYAVKHRIMYMYAPKLMKTGVSTWHETQLFVIEHSNGGNSVRFFDRRDF